MQKQKQKPKRESPIEYTSFNHPRWTMVESRCRVCGEQIVEAVEIGHEKPKRVECYKCLWRWFRAQTAPKHLH